MDAQVGLLPRVHGSGLFTRGLTQVLTIATLGLSGDNKRSRILQVKIVELLCISISDAPYTFGEVGRVKYNPGRREVGHGALAEKALVPVIPTKDEFSIYDHFDKSDHV